MIEVQKSTGFAVISDDRHVIGWAWHQLKIEAVELYVDDVFIKREWANKKIPDVNAPWDARGACFRIAIPSKFWDGRAHKIDLRLAVTGQSIDGAPIEQELGSATSERRIGTIKAIDSDGRISGWVEEPNSDWARPVCRIIINADFVIDFQAGQFGSPPQANDEGRLGFGYYIRVPAHLRDGRRITATLLVEEKDGWRVLDERSDPVSAPARGAIARKRFFYDRLVIIDPTLRAQRGHALGVANRLALAARDLSMDVTVLAHETAEPQWLEFGSLEPLFKKSPYDRLEENGIGSRLTAHEILIDSLSEQLTARRRRAPFYKSLVLYPTVPPAMAEAIAMSIDEQPLTDNELQCIFLMLESGLASHTPDGPRFVIDTIAAASYQRAFAKLAGLHKVSKDISDGDVEEETCAEKNVVIGAASQSLAKDFEELSPSPIRRLPPPLYIERSLDDVASNDDAKKSNKLNIGLYFGELKEDKGFLFTADIAERILKRHRNVVLHVQIHSGTSYMGAAQGIVERLQSLADRYKNLILYKEFIDGDAYSDLLQRQDIIVLGYHPQRYAGKTSGVYWESASLGMALVGPSPSWISHEASRDDLVFEGFEEHSAEAIGAALEALIKRRPSRDRALKPLKPLERQSVAFLKTWESARPVSYEARAGGVLEMMNAADYAVRLPVEADISARDTSAFAQGFSGLMTTGHNVKARWMGAAGEIRTFIDRSMPLQMTIIGEGSSDRRLLRSLKISVDGIPLEGRLDVQNKFSWRFDAVLPSQEQQFADKTVIALSFHDGAAFSANQDYEKVLIISRLLLKPVIAAQTCSQDQSACLEEDDAIDRSVEAAI